MRSPFSSAEKYKDHAILLARIGLGLFFVFVHGMPKVMGGSERWAAVGGAMSSLGIGIWPEFFGLLAGLSELVGGFLLILGLWFRPATLFIGATLFVASMSSIAGRGLAGSAHPVEVFLFLFVLFFVGPGKFSLDKR